MLNTTLSALRRVFTRPAYWVIALLTSAFVFTLGNVLPNLSIFSLIGAIEPFSAKVSIFLGSLTYFLYNGTVLTQTSFILTVLLSGISMSLGIYYMRRTVFSYKTSGMGALGIFAAFIGIGCGACGSVLLSTIIGVGASTYISAFLPLHGIEFGILGNGVLVITIAFISKKIVFPPVCAIPHQK